METVKGYQNIDREYIEEEPQSIDIDMGSWTHTFKMDVRNIKFDKDKDFTVGALIDALSKFDRNMPVTVIGFAGGIGEYDMHIHKVAPTTIYNFDVEDAAGIFLDDKFDEDDFIDENDDEE